MNQSDILDLNPVEEWGRLFRDPYSQLEFQAGMRCVHEHIPRGSRVLDAGGGPGRYALEMCRQGYDVVLVDVCAESITFARDRLREEPANVREHLLQLVTTDISDLSMFDDAQFDALLCFDPLSSIPGDTERRGAIAEFIRVTRSGGIMLTSVSGHFAVLRTLLARAREEIGGPAFDTLVEHGNASVRGASCHFFRADEMRMLMESCGLETIEMVGSHGLSCCLPDATNELANETHGGTRGWTC